MSGLSLQLLLLITHRFAPATVKLELIFRYMQPDSREGGLSHTVARNISYIRLPSDLISGS